MPLSYSSGYQSVRPINISNEALNPFGSALESINKRKEEAEKRQQQLISSREEISRDNYYGAHADVLSQASNYLIENEDSFAADDGSAQKYKQAWAQISELSDLFETFKSTTYGGPKDDPSGATFIAAEKRSAGIDPFYSEGFESTVGFNQMQEKLNQLNGRLYSVSFDEDLNLLVDGKSLAEIDFGTSQNPFDPKIAAADVSGARAFEGLWSGKEMTDDGIEAKMNVYLENPDNLNRAIKHYIQQSKEANPNYNSTIADLMADPDEVKAAVDQYIQEAKDYYRELYVETKKPSAADTASKKKRDEIIENIERGGSVEYVDGYDAAGDPISSSSGAEGLVSISLGTIYVDANNAGLYLIDSKKNRYDIGKGALDKSTRSAVQRALQNESGGITLNDLYTELTK